MSSEVPQGEQAPVPDVCAAVDQALRRLLALREPDGDRELCAAHDRLCCAAAPAVDAVLPEGALSAIRDADRALHEGAWDQARVALVTARGRLVRPAAVADRAGQDPEDPEDRGVSGSHGDRCSPMSSGSEGGSHGQVFSK